MRIIGVIVAAAMLVFFVLCFFAGVFDTMTVSVRDEGPFNLIFREHRGPYRGVRFALYDVYSYLKDKHSMQPQRGFVMFLDNPQKTKKEDLRCRAGCITDSIVANVSGQYATEVFAKTKAVRGSFRLRSFMSPMTGPVKFYPRMLETLRTEKLTSAGPVMEIYDVPAKTIIYIAPVK